MNTTNQTNAQKIAIWVDENKKRPFEQSSIFVNTKDGKLIISLDSNPRWQLLNKVYGLRVDLHNANSCKSFKINSIKLYSRQK